MRRISVIYGVLLLVFSLIRLVWRFNLFFNDRVVFIEWDIFGISSVNFLMTFLLDWIRVRFIGGVLLISSIVIFYSYRYIGEDLNINRFIILVFLFVMSMVLLILSPNLVRILLGWDGLGLVSYCLVIYYQNVKSARAGILTVLSNRVGDVAILLSISWIFNFGGWNFYYFAYIFNNRETILILWLVVLAAMTKRAQIPFSAWLPAAMAAPTPVSALVHSSTLVTAGVYLLIRFRELLGRSLFLCYISILTIVISGLGANFEIDLKKIIALSTLSQLGVIIITLSLGMAELAYFHLFRHALFKSLLFLCAGAYIHGYGDIQDIRILGGAGRIFPVTSLFFIGCSLSLCGFPFLSGFYSKDIILESFFIGEINFFLYALVIVGILATVGYSVRLVYYIFLKNLGLNTFILGGERLYMLVPIMILFFCSTLCGAVFRWLYLSPISIVLPIVIKLMVLVLSLFLVIFVWGEVAEKVISIPFIRKYTRFYLGGIWFLPYISTVFFVDNLKHGFKVVKFLDHGWLEKLGGQGIFSKVTSLSSALDNWNVIGVKTYLLILFLFMLFLLGMNYLNSLKRA